MSDSNNKIYVLASKKVASCVEGDIAVDALVSTINRVHNLIVDDYPEAKNFRLQFFNNEKNIDVVLMFERYEYDYDKIEIVEAKSKSSGWELIKKIVCGAIIVCSIITCYFYFTDSTDSTDSTDVVRTEAKVTSESYQENQPNYSTEETKVTSDSHQKDQPTRRPKYRDVKFSDSRDVYNYLNRKYFVSEDGKTLVHFAFDSGGFNVFANNKLLYTDVSVKHVRSDGAIIELRGPYASTTLVLKLDNFDHYLHDPKTGIFYSRKSINELL